MFWRLVLLAGVLSGCASLLLENKKGRYIREINAPVAAIRAIIQSQMPISLKSVSSNGREITSNYYFPGRDGYHDGDEADDRFMVRYTILGDRRPYDVEILVLHEQRVLDGVKFIYSQPRPDEHQASVLMERLRRELSKRREDRNVIDDFRVY